MASIADVAETYVTADTLCAELSGWMKDLEPYQWREPEHIDRDGVALLVVDMSTPFLKEGSPLASPNCRAIVPRVAELVASFRKAERPVIWIVQGHHSAEHDRGELLGSWWPGVILEGTDAVEMPEELAPAEGEKTIVKRRYSGFHATDLDCTLRSLGIKQVVVTGVFTNVCPYATAVDAFSHGYRVYYPPDCTATLNREMHIAALRTISGWIGHVVPSNWISEEL
jgi:nicotinamidase-related amidase